MKKVMIVLALSFCASMVFAQYTSKGNFLVGGTAGFSTAKSSVENKSSEVEVLNIGTRSTQLNVTPNFGYFVGDNLAVGLRMDYSKNNIKYNDGSVDSDNNTLFGPFARYYLPYTNNTAIFFGAGVGFGSSSDQIQLEQGQQNINTRMTAFSGGPGFTIFSNDAMGIEALMRYSYIRNDSDISIPTQPAIKTTTNTNQLDFSIGVQFYLSGVRAASGN